MNVFIIEDCQGSYIRKDANTGKFVAIRSKAAAMQWEDYSKAMNVLNNCLSREQKRRYIVSELFIPDCPKPEPQQTRQQKPQEQTHSPIIPQKKAEDKPATDKRQLLAQMVEEVKVIDMAPWEVSLSGLLQFAQGSEAKITKLSDDLSNIDKEIVDLQHYIEFTKLSSYHGYLAYKALRSKLQRRREIKNELEVLRSCESGKDGIESLQTILTAMQYVNNQSYSPRILEGLFQ